MHHRSSNIAVAGLSALIVPAALLVSIALAWQTLSLADFFYPQLYDALNIGAHIQRYGPQNRYRPGFETTSRAQRIRLFHGILEGVNHGGRGLAALRYRAADGVSRTLLRRPEIVHLTDVARLLARLRLAAWTAVALLVAAVAFLLALRRRPSRGALLAGGAGCAVLLAAITLAAFDDRRGGWFDRLHEAVFPAGHQWFFYYQESLMTTLMKAPDLFGPMAAMLGAVTLAYLLLILAAVEGATRRHAD